MNLFKHRDTCVPTIDTKLRLQLFKLIPNEIHIILMSIYALKLAQGTEREDRIHSADSTMDRSSFLFV